MTDEPIFNEQAQLITKAAALFREKIRTINSTEITENLSVEESVTRIFHVRSLNVYADVLDYVAVELLRSDAKTYYFLLPHVRTLLDIYARFLHLQLNCPLSSSKAMVCIAYQLYTLKSIKDGTEYRKALEIYAPFLNQQTLSFPRNPQDLEFRWMKKNQLVFADKSKIYRKTIFKHTRYTQKRYLKVREHTQYTATYLSTYTATPITIRERSTTKDSGLRL